MKSRLDTRLSVMNRKLREKLPRPVLKLIDATLAKAGNPDPEEVTSPKKTSALRTWGWLPLLTLVSSLGMLSVANADTIARAGVTSGDTFFWLGLLLIFVPSAIRLLSPAPSRFERIGLLCMVGLCFYFVVILSSPLYFSSFDEFLHWRTVDDIARSGHLFSENSMLPVSPFYPGLEIVTNAFSTLSGLDTFHAGLVVIGMARLIMILSLFMLYERLTQSARVAGIALIIYMTNPHFLFFDAQFSYESLALPLATFVIFALARQDALRREQRWITISAWLVLGAIIVTHHVTDFVSDGLLWLWVAVYALLRPLELWRSNLLKTAILGIALSITSVVLIGQPVEQYLSSYFVSALSELGQVLTGVSGARHLFSVYAGQPAPPWERIVAVASVALVVFPLPFGLLCIWQRYRSSALALMFGLVSLSYPLSQIFRLTNFGSEISDRAAAFLFIPIAAALAIFLVQFWPTRHLNRRQTALLTCLMTVMLLGGVVVGSGPPWELLPGPYLVAADDRSIEPEGIQAAMWTNIYLGPNNRIATDRTNQVLMSTYGDQRIVTSLDDKVEVSPLFLLPSLGPDELAILHDGNIRYLVVDQRLGKGLPSLGFYFEAGEPSSFSRTTPVDQNALSKFDTIPQINRVFDSGNIVIYDVRGLTNAQVP